MPEPRLDGLLRRPSVWREETRQLAGVPLWKNYRWQAVALLAVTGLVVVWWA